MIKRDYFLGKLKDKMWNGAVKIITGIRRCGKSFVLNEMFRGYLLKSGVTPDHIISVSLDLEEFEPLQNPRELSTRELSKYIRERIRDDGRYYVFIDEIQEARKVLKEGVDPAKIAKEDEPGIWFTFYDVLNSLNAKTNLDIYVTGSIRDLKRSTFKALSVSRTRSTGHGKYFLFARQATTSRKLSSRLGRRAYGQTMTASRTSEF